MKINKSAFFLGITFVWSWINWVIGLNYLSDGINDESIDHFVNYFFLGVYGPFLGAVITSTYYGGFKELLHLIKKLFIWKVPFVNYLTVIFLPLIFLASGIVLYALFIRDPGPFTIQAALGIPVLLAQAVLIGPLGEEIGWRGLLLPEMQKKYTPVTSAVIVGFIHFFWHLPLFWAPFGALLSGQSFSILLTLTYIVLVICWSCVQTWLVNTSRGSVLLPILFHLFINAGIPLIFFAEIYSNPGDAKSVYYLSSILTIPLIIFCCIKTNLTGRQRERVINV